MDLTTAQTHLDAWLAADIAVSGGQEYEIETGGSRRRLKRSDAQKIRENIDYWQGWVNKLTASATTGGNGGIRMKLVVNRD